MQRNYDFRPCCAGARLAHRDAGVSTVYPLPYRIGLHVSVQAWQYPETLTRILAMYAEYAVRAFCVHSLHAFRLQCHVSRLCIGRPRREVVQRAPLSSPRLTPHTPPFPPEGRSRHNTKGSGGKETEWTGMARGTRFLARTAVPIHRGLTWKQSKLDQAKASDSNTRTVFS